MILTDDIVYLKGVGPSKAKVLATELDIHTCGQLLEYFPFRHIDRSVMTTVASLTEESGYVVLRGTVSNMQTASIGPRRERLTVDFSDATGTLQLVWFQGIKWVREKLKPNVQYLVMGKPTLFNGQWQMSHPELEVSSGERSADSPQQVPPTKFLPVYNTTDRMKQHGLGTRALARLTETLCSCLGNVPETLPDELLSQYHLMGRREALIAIHYPESQQQLEAARTRLKFEELFFLQLDYQYAHASRQLHSAGRVFSAVGDHFNLFYREKIPFPLTGAQKRVIKEIREDMRSGRQMNRLLQGDVGSGKTLVALMCMLLALDNGCQACLMAPTEILATQHYYTFLRMLDGLDIRVELLIGSVRPADKKVIKECIAAGETQIVIGTHALIEDDVQFRDLGFVVIDEQHRFGVEQRARLWGKSAIPPHILVMTATPIPRTLAMTVYGDLDCSVIDELPPGRHPVLTYHRTEPRRPLVFSFLKKQIDAGRQAYFVYPLIHDNPKLDLRDLEDGLEMVQNYFPRPQYQVSMVHGQLRPEEKAFEMDRFKQGKTHIMVATTVIEVGVDVPNATVMVIENAERFGLAQLHQLRGRVGRGADQSYCILMTRDRLSHTSAERIRTMCSTTDGFQIAEADLRLRGPGDMQGLQQSGVLDLKLASIVDDEPLVAATRNYVHDLLAKDPTLSAYPLLQQHIERSKNKMLWGKIS
ncbi:MAG: ATP-dependent DNA helicase RecG [Bacteroidales bacterium]|nr:ATP-dependent DNA helicase RecG [Bacteroidales bacterium]